MFNKLTVIGRLGRDVEPKETQAGVKYWKFSVATNEWIKSKDEEETTWHSVTCWDEYHGKQLDAKGKKGALVYIEGMQKYNTYTNKDGIEITAGNLVMNRFGSVLKILEKSDAVTDGNVKPSTDDFDDDLPPF